MLEDLFKEELVKSMKERDTLRVSTLRMIISSIKDLEISRRSSNSNQIKDEDIIQILSKMIKQRREAALTYEKGGRKDLQDKENEEIKIIEIFMPNQLSVEEIHEIINDILNENDYKEMRDMGSAMSILKEKFSGKMDLGLASKIVKEKLEG
ncbi:MAG: GatB/YqeY domain-containing protein [Pseudomonadota bacterium]|nr:GatB/YqeY domain-containing protein [Pseudomonadota bacterium]